MKLPNEVLQPILEILTYCGAALIGWIAKWLQKKQIDKNKEQ